MTDEQLIAAEAQAQKIAQGCPIYLGDELYHATRSAARSANAADNWMLLRNEAVRRGLIAPK